jgi:peptidoglycan/LPS O-acetylase OafA/YrhL
MRSGSPLQLTRQQWAKIGMTTALAAIALVLVVQALALAIWPQAAAFKPLDSYPRTAIFTLVPALLATALFARLSKGGQDPAAKFTRIASIVLLLSIIPDYLLPDPNKTLLASSITALLHVVAALVTTLGLITGYRRAMQKS